jgi:serralysin
MSRRAGGLLALCVTVVIQVGVTSPAHAERSKRCFGRKPTIVGTQRRDVLTGTSGADIIAGLGGRDRIRGRRGNDFLCGDGGPDFLIGGSGRDRISGNSGPDRLRGGRRGDVLRAGTGFHHLFAPGPGRDRIRGARTLSDTVDYRGANRRVKINLGTGRASGFGFDRLYRVENAYGSRFGDRLVGNGHSNRLFGRRGDDTILGFANPIDLFANPSDLSVLDFLVGGGGDDVLDGGADLDVAVYSKATRGISVDLRAGHARGQGRDTISSVEAIYGTRFGDRLTGNGNENLFYGGAGNDSVAGEGGTDVASYLDARRAIRVNLGAGTSFGQGADRLGRVEDIYGSARGDRITGSPVPNRVWALEGNDVIFGLAGNDVLRGRAGRDRINGGIDIDACSGEVETNCERG